MEKTTDTEKLDSNKPQSVTIATTLGELISAISEAASEAKVDGKELARVTQLILQDLLERKKDQR